MTEKKDATKAKAAAKAKVSNKIKIPKGPPAGSEANASKRFESERISSHKLQKA